MKKQPVNIYKDEDVTPSNLTRINYHFQGSLEALEERIATLESQIKNHETRIETLEP